MLLSILLFSSVEILLQIFNIPKKGIYQGDPATLWTLRPNLEQELSNSTHPFYVQTDEHGFRGAGKEGAWLALGCSTTFGWGVEEEEAWPAQLSSIIGVPVMNGGVPGWSTHQAKQKVAEWASFQPPVVLVSYIVRDAQPATRSDREAIPSPIWSQLHMFRLMNMFGSSSKKSLEARGTYRVPVNEYQQNLRAIQDSFPNSTVLFFAFPQQEPATEWVDVLHTFSGFRIPQAPKEWFFEDDVIHLNPKGHRELAKAIRASLADASMLPPVH